MLRLDFAWIVAVVVSLETAIKLMRSSGLCDEWFKGVDHETWEVAKHVNGPLFTQLLDAVSYCDVGCVEMLRQGTPHFYFLVVSFRFVLCTRGFYCG